MINKIEVEDWVWIECAAMIVCPYCKRDVYLPDAGEIVKCECGKIFGMTYSVFEVHTKPIYTEEEILKQYDKKE